MDDIGLHGGVGWGSLHLHTCDMLRNCMVGWVGDDDVLCKHKTRFRRYPNDKESSP